MSKMVFSRAFDMSAVSLSDFTDGRVETASNTQFHVARGAYSADINGEDLLNNGTVTDLHGFKNGVTIFDVTGLSIPIDTVLNDRDEPGELANDLLGKDDVIKGSKYGDVLLGMTGDDVIVGGRGGDTLMGGDGADTLSGGRTNEDDRFVYTAVWESTKKSADLITDLGSDELIDLTAMDLASIQVTKAYSAKKDLTAFSIDVDGDHRADMVITASGNQMDFSTSHFVI
jgi:Ca2+-binding RTX toxin-like protein